ncbi:MAG: methyltransferase domain-containing protein [Rickettsiaceae bacterium H1]|nr:methyltransferase domain-containing protein [Rickettsiaceae bacterium H1]
MWINISLIQKFYETETGKRFNQEIKKSLVEYLNDKLTLCIGYNQLEKIKTIIPAKQGLVKGTVSAHENMLPIAKKSVDVVIIIHTIEHGNQEKPLLQEIYRILRPNGKVIFIFPNLYANISQCDQILKPGKSIIYFKHLLKKNLFITNNTNNILQLYKSIPGIVSVITAEKVPEQRTENINNITIPVKA